MSVTFQPDPYQKLGLTLAELEFGATFGCKPNFLMLNTVNIGRFHSVKLPWFLK
jgi:hypothetical protein